MSKENVTTRMVSDDDLPVVLGMVHALAAHNGDVSTLTREKLAQEARDWQRIVVACVAGRVVGYAALLPMGQLQFGVRGMDLHHLFVAAEHRGDGIGRALINASIDVSKQLSCKFMTVGTHPENTTAAQVYLAAGFEPLPERGPRFRIRLEGLA